MICSQCQATNQRDSAFCGNCGNSLTVMPGMSRPAAPSPHQYAPGAQDERYAYGTPAHQDNPGPYQRDPGPYQHQPGPAFNIKASPSRQFRLDLRRLNRVDQVVGGGSLVVLISLFLPWFGVSEFDQTFTANGTTSHGYLVIAVLLALLMIAYLVLRAGWDELPVNLPIAHAPLLLIGTGLQLLLVLIGFFDVPAAGLSWEIGAYLALIAAVAAAAPVVVPAVQSWQGSR